MATIEQVPPRREYSADSAPSNVLNSVLARAYTINWEVAFYLVVFVLAVFTRFVNLGDRVMSHDESLHTKYSHDLYSQGVFAHTPLMHGPVLFHMTALSYFLFGDSDFSARLYPAILGIIMVMMPVLLFRRWLGKFGAMATSVFILISPMLLFHHRYIREDTPAIFYTMLMVYAVFAYIDGVRPRQTFHLVLLSAATLLNLASKETAFIYILIFAAIVGLLLLLQIVQGWRRGFHSRALGWAVFGVVAVPIAGIAGTLASIKIAEWLNITFASPLVIPLPLLAEPIIIAADTLHMLYTVAVGTVLALLIGVVLVVIWSGVWALLGKPLGIPLLQAAGMRANSVFKVVMAGIVIGILAALLMTNVLSIITPESIRNSSALWSEYEAQMATAPAGVTLPQPTEYHPSILLGRFILWTVSIALALALVVIGTALVAFHRLPTLPWFDILAMAVLAVIVCLALLVVEERSRLVPNVSSEVRPTPSTFNNLWIYGAWVVGILSVLGIVALRFATTFFQEMRRYAAFDILLLLGSLSLPWSAAFPIFQAGYPLDGNFVDLRIITASVLGAIPFFAVAIVAGLCWRPGIWIVCYATFYALFAFFFTTIFTNPQGVATGLIGSLGYWLAQQGVRRGSQPQYYYMLIELPIYEYVLLIGGALAGIVGIAGLWRFRAARYQAVDHSGRLVPPGETQVTLDPDGEVRAAQSIIPYDSPVAARETQIDAHNATAIAAAQPGEAPAPQGGEETAGEDAPDPVPVEERLETLPFITFVGFWALTITLGLTMAGEKMPWLTTHIALPLCFLTGWYLGKVLERVNWQTFFRQSWALIVLIPALIVGLANVVGPFLLRGLNFTLLRQDQLQTFAWMGAIVLTGIVGYALYRVWRAVGTAQMVRVGVLGAFVLLGVLTARTAWMAAYINYDYPTEFLVYAHSAPQNKTVMNYIEEISRRTTDGMNIHVAYDNEVSWPGSWYFRNYPNARYLGDTTGATGLDEYVAIVVGDNNSKKIEGQLGDKFYKFDLPRLWWPMQEYFNLTLKRVDDAFADGEMRQALWDIWWARDYSTYARAYARMTGDTAPKFTLDKWYVIDRMAFYVRKDVAAQVWDFGIGSAKVTGLPPDPFSNLRCDTCAAEMVYGPVETRLLNPRGVKVGADGNTYVVDSQNGRVVVYDKDGKFLRSFGTPTTVTDPLQPAPGGQLREPWGITVGPDGTIYVADTWNHRVQVFANDGTFLRAWGVFEQVAPGQPGTNNGFYGPRDIAIDAQNRLFVADTGNKRVRVYDTQGNLLYDFGTPGRDAGQMYEPVGLAINDQTGEIFVANTWNKRIDVYTLAGQHLRSWTITGWYATTDTSDSGNRPYIALDPTGTYLFVSDSDTSRILVYDTYGTAVLSFGRRGEEPLTLNSFGALGGLTFDKEGRLVLVDASGARLLRFRPNAFPGLNPPQPGLIEPLPTQEATKDEVF